MGGFIHSKLQMWNSPANYDGNLYMLAVLILFTYTASTCITTIFRLRFTKYTVWLHTPLLLPLVSRLYTRSECRNDLNTFKFFRWAHPYNFFSPIVILVCHHFILMLSSLQNVPRCMLPRSHSWCLLTSTALPLGFLFNTHKF